MLSTAKFKQRVYEILEIAKPGDTVSRAVDFTILTLIILNVALVVASTFSVSETVQHVFSVIESISVVLFTIEYLLRLWIADLSFAQYTKCRARLRYAVSIMALVDLLSILPFYIPYLLPVDLRVLRILRVTRLFRMFKLNRYTSALSTIGNILKKKASQLLSSMFVVFLMMVISSILMYYAENPQQPEVFKNALSGFWWAIATLTTVGYGDIVPITSVGKLLSAVIALLGIGFVAVPTGIISSGFMEHIEAKKQQTCQKKPYCPYCGHHLDT